MTEQETVHVHLPSYFYDHYAPYAVVYVEWVFEEHSGPGAVAFIHRKVADTYIGHVPVPIGRYNTIAMVEGGDLIGIDSDGSGTFQVIGFEPTGQGVEDFFNQHID